jgi:hypothetical protein
MRYPPGQVDGEAGGIRVERVAGSGGQMEEVARMIERHNDHHDTA